MCGTCGCASAVPAPAPTGPDPFGPDPSAADPAPAARGTGASRRRPVVPEAPADAPERRLAEQPPIRDRGRVQAGPESPERGKAGPIRTHLLQQRLLAHNDRHAAANRDRLQLSGVLAVNLLSSPGSGKTALLEALGRLQPPAPAWPRQAVIVGDLATEHDAIRLRRAGLPAVQISTGMGCHLEAFQVGAAIDRLEAAGQPLEQLDLLWIENVGNLVCPAAYDLGEARRLVLLSVTEGEDKPLKYPALFHTADLVVISKRDLAEAVGFRREQAHQAIHRVAPRARILEVSARSGAGLQALLDQLQAWSLQRPSGSDPAPAARWEAPTAAPGPILREPAAEGQAERNPGVVPDREGPWPERARGGP